MKDKKSDKEERPSIFGAMAGTLTITGDIISPEPDIWNAELGFDHYDENGPVYWDEELKKVAKI